jgi:hypothetical protein
MQRLANEPMFLLRNNTVKKVFPNARPANVIRTGLKETIMNDDALQGLRRWLLATKDAHGLYAKFGFSALDKPEHIMCFKTFEEYPVINS